MRSKRKRVRVASSENLKMNYCSLFFLLCLINISTQMITKAALRIINLKQSGSRLWKRGYFSISSVGRWKCNYKINSKENFLFFLFFLSNCSCTSIRNKSHNPAYFFTIFDQFDLKVVWKIISRFFSAITNHLRLLRKWTGFSKVGFLTSRQLGETNRHIKYQNGPFFEKQSNLK